MIDKGLEWEKTRILPTGEISIVGNTRIAGKETGTLGKVKGVDHKMVFRGFAYWGLVTGNQQWLEIAKRVSAHYSRPKSALSDRSYCSSSNNDWIIPITTPNTPPRLTIACSSVLTIPCTAASKSSGEVA